MAQRKSLVPSSYRSVLSGTYAARPAATIGENVVFINTDEPKRLSLSNGSAWTEFPFGAGMYDEVVLATPDTDATQANVAVTDINHSGGSRVEASVTVPAGTDRYYNVRCNIPVAGGNVYHQIYFKYYDNASGYGTAVLLAEQVSGSGTSVPALSTLNAELDLKLTAGATYKFFGQHGGDTQNGTCSRAGVSYTISRYALGVTVSGS